MRAALLIAAKDVRQRFRDRSALVLVLLAPLLISFLMSSAFGGAQDLHVTLAVVDEDGGPMAEALVGVLASDELQDLFTLEEHRSRASALAAVDDDGADAGLVIPSGFSAAVVEGTAADLEVLASVDATLSSAITRSVAQGFLNEVQARRIAVATAVAGGAPADDVDALVERAGEVPAALAVEVGELGGRELDLISYYAPGMAVFFVLFAVGFAARSWWIEDREGTLDRMAAAPIPSWAVITGKALAVFVYGAASLATMAAVTSLVFGAHWGPAPAVAAIIVAVSLATVALTALVIALTRTEQQADGLASMITFALAILGGSFIFIGSAPEAFQRVALITPVGWMLRGITDLSTGAPASAAVVPVLAILAFTAVVGAVAGLASRWRAAG